jgi:hypothetical protein
MIKINLLPKGVNQKTVVRNTAILFGAILLFVLVGGTAYHFKLVGDVKQMEVQAEAAEAWEARVKGIQKQTTDMLDAIKPIQAKLDFINAVLDYNLKYPKLYEDAARWTYQKVVLVGMSCDGTTLTLTARVKSLDDLGRYLLNMYRATDLFTEVAISGIPGYGGSQAGGYPTAPSGGPGPGDMGGQISGSQANLAGIGAIAGSVERMPMAGSWIGFTVTCKLKTPIVAPTFAAQTSGPQPGGSTAPAPPTAATTGPSSDFNSSGRMSRPMGRGGGNEPMP